MAYSSKKKIQLIVSIIKMLRIATKNMVPPAATAIIQHYGKNPFLILVSCVLSPRTKDTVSLPASQRLFDYARSPQELLLLSSETIEKLIYPVGFYRQKASQLRKLSSMLIEKYNGIVPSTKKDLLTLPGVGPKIANLVLGDAFGIPAICVDTHVHRISNRLGLVKTTTPLETERALEEIIPVSYWSEYNKLMVMLGQNICLPTSPLCSLCPLLKICPQRGVIRHR